MALKIKLFQMLKRIVRSHFSDNVLRVMHYCMNCVLALTF